MKHAVRPPRIDALLEAHRVASRAEVTFALGRTGTLLGSAGDPSRIDANELADRVAQRATVHDLLELHEVTMEDAGDTGLDAHVRLGAGDFILVSIVRSHAMDQKVRLSAVRTAYELGLLLEEA